MNSSLCRRMDVKCDGQLEGCEMIGTMSGDHSPWPDASPLYLIQAQMLRKQTPLRVRILMQAHVAHASTIIGSHVHQCHMCKACCYGPLQSTSGFATRRNTSQANIDATNGLCSSQLSRQMCYVIGFGIT